MKRIIGLIMFSVFTITLLGQNTVDEMFETCSEDKGFINITLSGSFFKMLRSRDDCCSGQAWPAEVTSVRILFPGEEQKKRTNFMAMIKRNRDLKYYEDYMSVKEKDQEIRMLVKADGKMIREFLLVGGGEDNFILQVKGRITLEEAEELSRELRNDKARKTISGL
ncbi:MAG: DUF4252 domain-containing protein [Bacteroidales bacterium]|jgi:hypothetical protein